MTSVNVTTVKSETVVFEETSGSQTIVSTESAYSVTAITEGPQGAVGPQGPQGPAGLAINDLAKIDKSIVYYDAQAATYRADALWTTSTLTDGGNF